MRVICQKRLPFSPWESEVTARLPGIQPLKNGILFLQDDAFDKQMEYRDELILKSRKKVFQLDNEASSAAKELLVMVLKKLNTNQNYKISKSEVTRPDGKSVALNGDNALIIAGRLVQEDLLILHWDEHLQEHSLKGGILCFPALWTLEEKMNKPMSRIHRPVNHYTEKISKLVQRMFTNLKVETPLWRANWYLYNDPELFTPQKESFSQTTRKSFFEGDFWVRVERQTLVRLPESDAIVFGIHTFVVGKHDLTHHQIDSLKKVKPE